MVPTLYRSTDAGAPVLNGTVGALVNLLDAILVNGYGVKDDLGWAITHTATDRRIYRAPAVSGATRCFYEVLDNAPDVTQLARCARIQGLEAVTTLGTGTNLTSDGTGRFAHTINASLQKSITADTTARPWIAIGDDKTLYLFVQTGGAAGTYAGYVFGDFHTLVTGDVWKGHLIAQNGFIATYANENFGYLSGMNLGSMPGHWMQRNWSGIQQNINFAKIGDHARSGYTSSGSFFGALTLPHAPDGGLYLAPIYVTEGVGGTAMTQRGMMRGIFHPLHPIASWNDGDTFAGAGAYAGKQFLAIKQVALAASQYGVCIVETTEWLD